MLPTVRPATAADAEACAAIYAPYVTDSAITFETDVPTAADFSQRIVSAHAWMVAEVDGRTVGYAYAGPFAVRAAYRWSCEVSAYVEIGRRRAGAGRALYTELLDRLRCMGLLVAVAKISLPNEASIGLHRSFGFEDVGVHRAIGYKGGVWHDVAILQLALGQQNSGPTEPRLEG